MAAHPLLVIRADANASIGSGHILRSLALAQAWAEKSGRVFFISGAELSISFQNRLRGLGIELCLISVSPGSGDDAAKTREILNRLNPDWLVIDGYSFGESYQKSLLGLCPMMILDDTAENAYYYADVILNPNAYAEPGLYTGKTSASAVLAGTLYAPLRREFRDLKPAEKTGKSEVSRVLITLGGGDSSNLTAKCLEALSLLGPEGLEVKVVAGADNPHRALLDQQIARSPVKTELVLAPENMAPFFEWADLAVTAGGSTCWEAAYMGVPSLCIILADNQRRIVEFLDRAGIVRSLGFWTDVAPLGIARHLRELLLASDLRKEMSKRGRLLIDGQGAPRAVNYLLDANNRVQTRGRRL